MKSIFFCVHEVTWRIKLSVSAALTIDGIMLPVASELNLRKRRLEPTEHESLEPEEGARKQMESAARTVLPDEDVTDVVAEFLRRQHAKKRQHLVVYN